MTTTFSSPRTDRFATQSPRGTGPDQITFIIDALRQIATRAAGRPIALYGGGKHTEFVLGAIKGVTGMPVISYIVDDAASPGRHVRGVPVVTPAQAPEDDIAMVVVSSDSIQDVLTRRANEWVRSRFAAHAALLAPIVVPLYDADVASRFVTRGDQFRGVWGRTADLIADHLPMSPDQRVLRVPAAPEAITSPTRPGDFPLPPAAIRAGYSVNDDERYLASGAMDVAAIRSMIERHAPGFAPTRVLDWGCSTGRLIRHWLDVANAGGEVWGVDLCATAINWATENLSPPFRFVQGTSRPRLPFADASLDFVYANSVFTHIRELWDTWLMELRRVIRPGGLLFVTILDEKCWEWIGRSKGNLISKACDGIDFTQPLTDDFVAHGSGGDVVSFWHTRGVRRRWAFAFDILAMEYGTVYNQTGVLLRRP